MTPSTEKTLQTVAVGATAFFVALFLMLGGVYLYQNRSPSDGSFQGWFSDEDLKALRDPAAANQAAYEEIGRDAWQQSQSVKPPAWHQ